jgi:hypothetical protein
MSECPNCGAPKRGAVCEYCGTHFGRYQGQATVEVEPDATIIYNWDGTPIVIQNAPNVNLTIVHEDD